MPAIKSTGAYVPYYRLKREEIVRAWGSGSPKGERAVANFDEDSITMAVEAGRDCLKGLDRDIIDGLYFASSSAPFLEKQSASIIAAGLDLKKEAFTVDITDSMRAGTNALKLAIDAIDAGTAKNILVIASDCRLGKPGSGLEQEFGDGAVSLLISNEGDIEFESFYTHTSEIYDQWRTHEQDFVNMWEDRFVYTQGYLDKIKDTTDAFMKKMNSSIQDFDKISMYAPGSRRHIEACRMLKLDPKSDNVQDTMLDVVGNTGTASALLVFVASIEDAKAGDRLLLMNYGDGCDLFIFKVKNKLVLRDRQKGVVGYLKSKSYLKNYEKYIQFRRLMDVQTGRKRPPMVSSAVALNRGRAMIYSLHAGECANCGRAFFPPQRICNYCRAKDQVKEFSISDQRGTLFSFCKDLVAESIDPPVVVCIVNLEGNLRFVGGMTDRNSDNIEMDMPVEFTFRKISDAGGYYNYFWKCRPIR
ncbi:MAG: zinc ribbon domain-containing protein [Spirochaetota bacterium]|nr:zinc ribbon domain-containing protein [Spirochaetota bacterium]